MGIAEPEDTPIHPAEIRATIWFVADIYAELVLIRRLIEEGDDGEEEAEADDA